MNNSNIIKKLTITAWALLGLKRGINSYDYNYSRNRLYKNSLIGPFYIDKAGWGFAGIMIYLSPVTFLFALYKEVYRLEVNLRGLEDEKKTDCYNEVL
jgi:hypothetical protein